jgi:hypothetical protein
VLTRFEQYLIASHRYVYEHKQLLIMIAIRGAALSVLQSLSESAKKRLVFQASLRTM